MKQTERFTTWPLIRNATIYLFTIFKNKSVYYRREGRKEGGEKLFKYLFNSLIIYM